MKTKEAQAATLQNTNRLISHLRKTKGFTGKEFSEAELASFYPQNKKAPCFVKQDAFEIV